MSYFQHVGLESVAPAGQEELLFGELAVTDEQEGAIAIRDPDDEGVVVGTAIRRERRTGSEYPDLGSADRARAAQRVRMQDRRPTAAQIGQELLVGASHPFALTLAGVPLF